MNEREKVYSAQYNNTAVETVSNNTKWRAARKAQGPSQLATHCNRTITQNQFSAYCKVQGAKGTNVHKSATPGQLSLAIPLWVVAVSTSQRAVMPCGWGVKAGMVCVWVAGKTV